MMGSNKPRVHYHSDCYFFAGCENMLVNFFSDQEIRNHFEISFSYRYSEMYEKGLHQRVEFNFPSYPLKLPVAPESFNHSKFGFLRRLALKMMYVILTPCYLLVQTYQLWRLFSRITPQILHINNGGYPAALSARSAALAGWFARVPSIVMVVNNFAVDYSRPSRWFGYFVDRLIVTAVKQFVTGSSAAAERLKSVLRLPEYQCISIHNGVKRRQPNENPTETRARFGLSDFKGVVFGVVAILRPNKGHMVLLEAINFLVNQHADIRAEIKILIEGDGLSRDLLVEYVKKTRLEDVCHFVGNESNVMNFISTIDTLILPSVCDEDFPNVILEAMGFGKAIIASRLAGTPEQVVEGVTGLLVEPGNVIQLAEAIYKMLHDRRLVEAMGRASRQRFIENFTAERSVEKYLMLYHSMEVLK